MKIKRISHSEHGKLLPSRHLGLNINLLEAFSETFYQKYQELYLVTHRFKYAQKSGASFSISEAFESIQCQRLFPPREKFSQCLDEGIKKHEEILRRYLPRINGQLNLNIESFKQQLFRKFFPQNIGGRKSKMGFGHDFLTMAVVSMLK